MREWTRRTAYNLCRRRGLSHEDAEDAAQTICANIARLGHDSVSVVYLLRSARNAAADLTRRPLFIPLAPDYDDVDDPRQDLDTLIAQRERLRWARSQVSAEEWRVLISAGQQGQGHRGNGEPAKTRVRRHRRTRRLREAAIA